MVFYDESNFEPDRSIGYLVRRAHQLGSTALEPLLAAEGLTGTQWSALVAVWFRPGSTAADIARELGHDKGAMTRLVEMLVERGWLVRERGVEDRRCINLALTPAGEDVALRCRGHAIDCWNSWLADWSRDEVETLIGSLQKLRVTLATVDGPCS